MRVPAGERAVQAARELLFLHEPDLPNHLRRGIREPTEVSRAARVRAEQVLKMKKNSWKI